MKRHSLRRSALILLAVLLCGVLSACGGTKITLHNGSETSTASVSGSFTLPVPSRVGFAFTGWYSAAEGGTAYTDAEGNGISEWSASNPTDLYAQWSLKDYTFRLDTQGGTIEGEPTFTMQYLAIFNGNFPVPVKDGYAFEGWHNSNNQPVTNALGVPLGDCIQFNATGYPTDEASNTVSLFAKWTEKNVTFTFVTDGGTEVAELKAGLGAEVDLPVTAKEGHCFIGWSRSGGAEELLPMRYTVKQTDDENTSLYAVWRTATEAGVTFSSINNDTEYSVTYIGSAEEVYIPDIYQGKRVTKVVSIAKSVKVLYLPNTASTINEGAMMDCTALVKLRLPSTLTRLSKNVLKGCRLLADVMIPASVTAIDEGALSGTGFVTITVPAGVRSIGLHALDSHSVVEILVQQGNQYYASLDGVLYQKTGAELQLQQYPRLRTGEEFTPAEGCIAIMTDAFHLVGYDKNGKQISGALKKLNITGKLKTVENGACQGSSLMLVVINTESGSALSFGTRAFCDCKSLRMIRFLNAAVPAAIGNDFISTGNGTYIYVPTASKTMYAQKLSAYSSRIRTENDIYGSYAVESYQGGYRILQYLGYESEVTIPAYINGLEVKAIGSGAFKNCTTVKKISVGATTVLAIEAEAFANCTALTSFTIQTVTPPTLASGAFVGCGAELRIYVPAGEAVNSYRAANGWSSFGDVIYTVSG